MPRKKQPAHKVLTYGIPGDLLWGGVPTKEENIPEFIKAWRDDLISKGLAEKYVHVLTRTEEITLRDMFTRQDQKKQRRRWGAEGGEAPKKRLGIYQAVVQLQRSNKSAEQAWKAIPLSEYDPLRVTSPKDGEAYTVYRLQCADGIKVAQASTRTNKELQLSRKSFDRYYYEIRNQGLPKDHSQ